jgi:hypothetical protein
MMEWRSPAVRALEKRLVSLEKKLSRLEKDLDGHNTRKEQREQYLSFLFKTFLPVVIAGVGIFIAADVIKPF